MGRDGIVVAGVLGVLSVLIVWRWPEPILALLTWPRRYVRARGYEFELARHTAAGLRAELDATGHGPVTYGTVAYAPVSGEPPWPLEVSHGKPRDYALERTLAEPRWLSDMEAAGEPVPAWAAPDADRSSAYGLNSGSSGSDYHGGELPTAGEGGACRPLKALGTRAAGGPGSEPYGVTGPATYPDDPALDETWARLEKAWAQESSAGIPQPARDPNFGAVERGREDDGSTGTATRELALGSPIPLGSTGAGGAVPVTPGSAPGSRDAAAVASPGPGSRLATRFDVELAAQCARWIREQDRDTWAYLERLERRMGVRQ